MSYKKLTRLENLRLALSATLIVLSINAIIPSSMNGFTETINLDWGPLWENAEATAAYEYRCKTTVFKRRPVILKFQEYTHHYLDWPFQFSFNVVNLVLIFGFFILMFYWSELLLHIIGETHSFNPSILWLWLISSLSISCAFFATNLAYDDFLQFFLLTATLILFFKEHLLFSAVCFFLACLSRETSLLYLPILMAFSVLWHAKWIKVWSFLGASILIYVIFLSTYLGQAGIDDSVQFLKNNRVYAWQSNFENMQRARESLTIGAIMTLLPLYLLTKQLDSLDSNPRRIILLKVSIGFIFLNAVIVYLFALARESRLYFIPLILATPLLIEPFGQLIKDVMHLFISKRWLIISVGVLVGIGVGGLFYTPYTVGTGYLFKMYAIVYFSILWMAIYLSYCDVKKG